VPQPNPMATLMALYGSSVSESTSTVREVSTTAVAIEKAAEKRTAKETVMAKVAEEGTIVKWLWIMPWWRR
jgi:hypothetical protein